MYETAHTNFLLLHMHKHTHIQYVHVQTSTHTHTHTHTHTRTDTHGHTHTRTVLTGPDTPTHSCLHSFTQASTQPHTCMLGTQTTLVLSTPELAACPCTGGRVSRRQQDWWPCWQQGHQPYLHSCMAPSVQCIRPPTHTHTRTHNTTQHNTCTHNTMADVQKAHFQYNNKVKSTDAHNKQAGKHSSIHLLVSDNNSIYGHYPSVQGMHIKPCMSPLTVRSDRHYVAPVLLRYSVLICVLCC